MSRRRLSKKQLKQDKFVSTTFELAQFAQEHTRNVVIGAVAVVLIIAAGLYYWQYRSHSQSRAASVLMNGRIAYDAGNFQLAISDMEIFRDKYSGTKYGEEGMVILADSYFQVADYTSARSVLERFVDRYSNHSPLSSKAYYLLGCSLENTGEFDEAAQSYLRASDCARFDYQRVARRMDAARAYRQAGKYEEAAETYRQILDHYPDVQESTQATLLLSEIEASALLATE